MKISYGISLLILISLFKFLNPTTPAIRLAILISIYVLMSLYFICLDYYFIGLTYIIVYVGAIAILFIFVIMLLNQSLLTTKKTNLTEVRINELKGSKDINLTDLLILNKIEKCPKSNLNRLGYENRKGNFGKNLVYFILILNFIIMMNMGSTNELIKEIFIIDWSTEYNTLTDLMILGYHLFLGYPLIILLIGILLWILLIGILNIIE